VYGGDRDEGSFVEPVKNGVDAFEEFADALVAQSWIECGGAMVKLAEVGSGTEAGFLRAGDNAGGGFASELLGDFDEVFQLI
jgi:hypothetical protein